MRLAIGIITGILLGIGVGSFLFLLATQVEERVLFTSARVGTHIGFDVNASALTFGTVLPGGNKERTIYVSNNNRFPVVARMDVAGSIAEYLSVSQAQFSLAPFANKTLYVNVFVPREVPVGTALNGTVKVTLWREW